MEAGPVNIPLRRAYAELLRHFFAGLMTNREYEDRWWDLCKQHGSDAGAEAIFDVWDDAVSFRSYRMTDLGRQTDAEGRAAQLRCLLFLYSDAPYSGECSSLSSLLTGSAVFGLLVLVTFCAIYGTQSQTPLAGLCWVFLATATALVSAAVFVTLGRALVRERFPSPRGSAQAPPISFWPFADEADFQAVRGRTILLG